MCLLTHCWHLLSTDVLCYFILSAAFKGTTIIFKIFFLGDLAPAYPQQWLTIEKNVFWIWMDMSTRPFWTIRSAFVKRHPTTAHTAPVAISLNHSTDIPPTFSVFMHKMMPIAYFCDCKMGCSSRVELRASHYSFFWLTQNLNRRELWLWHFEGQKDGNVH